MTKFDRNEDDESPVIYNVELSEADDEQAGSPFELGPYETE